MLPGASFGRDRRSLVPLARNALRKLRSLRHPDVLRYIDGYETDTAVYMITESVEPLTSRIGNEGQQPGQGDEWKIWGLSRVVVSVVRRSQCDSWTDCSSE